MTDPDQIRSDIERTRGQLSANVNALTESVKPGNLAHRQVEKARGAVVGVKDRVMGVADQASSGAGSTASNISSGAADAASSVSGALTGAPQAVKTQTRGNPLAAGLIALGIGYLVGSILPASSKEAEAASTVKDNAATLAQPATDAAKSAVSELKQPAQEAFESVRSTAADAAAMVKNEGTSSVQDVKGQAQDANNAVQDART